jgi:hypothetical protein
MILIKLNSEVSIGGEGLMEEKKCPDCGSANVVKIVYGMPSEETVEAELRGEFILRGDIIFPDSPGMHCRECGEDFCGGCKRCMEDNFHK